MFLLLNLICTRLLVCSMSTIIFNDFFTNFWIDWINFTQCYLMVSCRNHTRTVLIIILPFVMQSSFLISLLQMTYKFSIWYNQVSFTSSLTQILRLTINIHELFCRFEDWQGAISCWNTQVTLLSTRSRTLFLENHYSLYFPIFIIPLTETRPWGSSTEKHTQKFFLLDVSPTEQCV